MPMNCHCFRGQPPWLFITEATRFKDSYAGAKGEPAMSPQVKAQIMELLRVSGTASNNLHPSVQGNEEANKSDNNNNDDDDDDEILSYEEKMEEYEVLIEAGIEAEAMAAEEEAAEEEELSEEVKTANLLTNILTDQGNESNVLKDELESRLDALAISDCPKQ
ncbi:hypothetical protein BDN71DRAFT_810260 [Pleurotus eryngii]|uniref:Uncharacterized protein n=1 Tax=Pleurotus eryngii TaxID=5323 RepID=A0A9P5ZJ59_PLEER|nr:hypothetical protein BDN71DRAFT_810260 [Pleurotus eryngii]